MGRADWSTQCQDNVTGCGIKPSVFGHDTLVRQHYKSEHWAPCRRKKMLKATLNENKQTDKRTNEPPHDKTNNVAVRQAKTQISLGIRPVWSVFAVRWMGS